MGDIVPLPAGVGPNDPIYEAASGRDSPIRRRLLLLSRVLAAAVVAAAVVVLVGWALDLPALKSICPGWASMKPNTALGLLLGGIGLWPVTTARESVWLRRTVGLAGAGVVLLGALTLSQCLLGRDLGIDQALFLDPDTPVTAHPGRMAPATTLCFVLFGCALLLSGRREARPSQFVALTLAFVSGVGVLGYLYGVKELYGLQAHYASVALHTALAFLALSLGLTIARPDTGLMLTITSSRMGAVMARRLLPWALGGPILLGWVRLRAEQAGHFGTSFGVSLLVLSTIVLLATLIFTTAVALNRLDTQREVAVDSLRHREAHQRAILDSALDAVISIDAESRITYWNPRAEKIFGWSAQEAVGRDLAELVMPEAHRAPHRRGLERFLASGEAAILDRPVEMPGLRRDGTTVPLELRVRALRGSGSWSFNAFVADLSDLKRAQAEQRWSDERYRRFFDEDLAGAFITTPDGRILECNPAFARILGFASPDEARGCNILSLYSDAGVRRSLLERLRIERKILGEELELRRHDGAPVHVIENVVASFEATGELAEITGYVFDVSERKKAEDQLRQAQKIEAIGQLAGGVAHDFNNLLGVITGYAGMLAKRLPSEDPSTRYVAAIQTASDRAAALTRQLLAFSRKQILQPKVVDLNEVTAEMEKLIARLIGEDIDLVKLRHPGSAFVRADPSQLEQIILNLAVNARDAMPQGGSLTVETAVVDLDDAYVISHLGARPGRYVMLAVSDTGIGMDAETQARIFEPFFTTKELGKGTGLGLSTVYGIVKQSGGCIWVYSEPGKGATFKVYLPRVEKGAERAAPLVAQAPPPRGSETILLVEDEEMLRGLIGESLATSGYKVLVAGHGAEALAIAERHEGTIHLLLTDTVMPGMGGRELAKQLSESRQGLKVLYMSGYTDDAVVRHGVLAAEVAFLQKPFTPDALARKVRDVLDA